ncbi:MAG: hypothetical protein HKN23_13475 [Verrucomicrobiales bacterium]|nr:hypothetical protein [Verrucomicrobiales bacterium]
MPEIEIEEPTEQQRLNAVKSQAIRMAAKADFDTQIIAYLVTQEIPKEQARRMLPEIREEARPLMNKYFAGKRLIGWLMLVVAAGIFAWAVIDKEQRIVGLVIGLIPLFAGINQILKSRTPADSELGLPVSQD